MAFGRNKGTTGSTGATGSTGRRLSLPGGKRLLAAAGGLVVLIGLFVFGGMFIDGWKSTPVDSIGLHYSGGPIDGQVFQEVIDPGSGAKFLGIQESLFLLPVTQRDYTASNASGADGGPIVAPAQGGVEMQFEVAAYFTLNTGDAVVRQFYERVCVKFDCTSTFGWDEMLRVNFRGPIEQAIQQSVRGFTVDELYAGVSDGEGDEAVAILEQVQDSIAADLKENINNILGGPFFCGPTFSRSSPDVCPDFEFQITSAVPTSEAVRQAFAQNAASEQAIVTAQNRAQAAVAEAEGQREAQEALQGLYQDPAYISYLQALALQDCANNTNCTLVVTDGGTEINVDTGGSGLG